MNFSLLNAGGIRPRSLALLRPTQHCVWSRQESSGCAASGKIAEGQTLTVNALRVLHGPYGFVSRRVFVAIPRRSTDVQVGVGSSGKHNPRPGVTHGSREPALR